MASTIKTAVHPPTGHRIDFDCGPHRYRVRETGQYLESGTTFIGKFFPKFDSKAISARIAGRGKYKNKTQDQILAEWAAEGLRGRTEGENLHYFLECLRNGTRPLPEPQSDREAKLFEHGARTIMRYEELFSWVGSEVIIASPDAGLAGQVDDWMFDSTTMTYILNDWKQNKAIKTENPWERALPPIDHLEACDWVKYCLQLNLYRWIMEREKYGLHDDNGYRLALTHITPDFAQPKKVPDMQDEIQAMIEWNLQRRQKK